MIKTVLFDLDGTLVDTERAFLRGNAKAAQDLGFALQPRDFLPLVGNGGDAELAFVASKVGQTNVPAFMRLTREYVDRWLTGPATIALPGAGDTLQALHDAQIKLGIVTSSGRRHLDLVLAKTGWAPLLDWTITLGGGQPKPAPDLYLEALATSHQPAATTLAVEDSGLGVQAAQAAELRVIQIKDLAPLEPFATIALPNIAAVPKWVAAQR